MIKDYMTGKKVTPKQFAARVIQLCETIDYWNEKFEDEFDLMTEKEREDVRAQVEEYQKRIRAMLKPTLDKIGE